MKPHWILGAVIIITISISAPSDSAGYFRRNGETLNINWVTSLPWDVSNTLRAPLGAPLSLLLTSCMAVIMFFGMAVSPVYYLLGTPRRPYNIHDAVLDRLVKTGKEDSSRVFPRNATMERIVNATTKEEESELVGVFQKYPNFMESFFWFIGEEEESCQQLMVCHAHGFFNFMPKQYLKYYRIFSKRIVQIPKEFQEAVTTGLDDQSLCLKKYRSCPHDLVSIAKTTFQNVVPTDLSGFSKIILTLKDWIQEK